MKYHVKEFRPDMWWVVDQNNHPIYDDAPEGNDSPVVFRDPDAADECAARLNSETENH